jgi:hypothetical protein
MKFSGTPEMSCVNEYHKEGNNYQLLSFAPGVIMGEGKTMLTDT